MVAETILQETCHQTVMVSEMTDHPEDLTVDPQEVEASGTEVASEIEVASEAVIEAGITEHATCANKKVILPEIALSRETEATVREVAISQESLEALQ